MGPALDLITVGEAFVAKYPMSPYLVCRVFDSDWRLLDRATRSAKMMDAGTKALFLNPDDIDVLPLMGWAISAAGEQQDAGRCGAACRRPRATRITPSR